MKIHTQWRQHVEARRESGLSQADYCRQQGLNPKTFSTWTQRELSFDKTAPLEIIPVHVASSVPVAYHRNQGNASVVPARRTA